MEPTNPSNPAPESSETKLPAAVHKKLKPALIAGLVLIVVGSAVAYAYVKHRKQAAHEDIYLRVVNVSPQGTAANQNSKIFVSFNLPVTAHHMQDFMAVTTQGYTNYSADNLSPVVSGTVVQGSSPFEIVFQPAGILNPGSTIKIVLKEGLPSDSGRKLLSDYEFSFGVKLEGNAINFTYKNFAGKVMSFDADKGASLSVEVGSEITDPSVKIYKVPTADVLLNSLTYNQGSDSQGYATYYGSYAEKPIDTSNLQLIREVKNLDQNNQIEFKEAVGLYLFEAFEKGQVRQTTWVSLNNLGVHLRQDDQKITLAAQQLKTSAAENNIDVSFYTMSNKLTLIDKKTLSGIQQYYLPYESHVDLVLAQKGNDTMIIPIGLPNSQAEIAMYQNLGQKYQILVYTDRPIYKKGDKIQYRGVVRLDNDANYSVPTNGTQIRVTFNGEEQIAETGDGGIFSGGFAIPSNIEAGTKYLYASGTNNNSTYYSDFSTYFDVINYIKPAFGLDVTVDKTDLLRSDKITATITGKYFDGRPMSGEQIDYTVFRRDFYETEKAAYNRAFNLNGWGGMCGGGISEWQEYYGEKLGDIQKITLDPSGKATINFDTSTISQGISQEITFVAEKTDENNNKVTSAKGSVVHAGEFNIFFRPGADRIKSGEKFTAVFYAENRDGTKLASKQFNYSLYETVYQPGSATQGKNIIKTGIITTNSEGLGSLEEVYDHPNFSSLNLEVNAQDSKGNLVSGLKYLFFFNEPDLYTQDTVLKIVSNVSNLTPGKNAVLNIQSPADIMALVAFEKGRVYDAQWVKLKTGQNTFNFAVPATYVPSITPTFSFFYNGHYYIEGISLNVPALSKVMTVSVSTDKPKYNPGDTAQITIETRDAANSPISANVGVGIVDKAIYALRKNATPPLHSSFYFFRRRTTNTSSSLTWIGAYDYGGKGGGGGGDLEALNKDIDTLYWDPNLKTDSSGKLTISVPVKDAQTTWKILSYGSNSDTKLGQGELDFLVAR